MTDRLFCKHGNQIGISIPPCAFYADGFDVGKDGIIIQRIMMPVCDQCCLEAVGFAEHQIVTKEG